MASPRTLFRKIWDSRAVSQLPGAPAILYIDPQLIHEASLPETFTGPASGGPKCGGPTGPSLPRATASRRAGRCPTSSTSGSTGEPKGVMHSFRTMWSAFAFAEVTGLTSSDRLISYLPLAHVAERAVLETTHFRTGCQVFFVESLDTFLADVRRARPTSFGSVPPGPG